MRRYAEYVEEGLLRDLDSPLARLEGQTILGTETFRDRVRRAYVLTRTEDRREQPAFARARRSIPFDAVARAVGRSGVKPQSLLRGGARTGGRGNCCSTACVTSAAGGDSHRVGAGPGLSLSGLTMARDRVQKGCGRIPACAQPGPD